MFKNRVRLPTYLKEAQFPSEANRFRLSNGESKTLSVTIRKTYTFLSDYMNELMHQRLVIALNHDEVNIEGDKYFGGVTVDGDYEIAWPDFLDYPLGQATVKIQVTPFDTTNSNCATCEEAGQLSLVDDQAGEMAEGGVVNVSAYDNDTICCFPVTAEITWFNTAYLVSVTIVDATGVITLTVKNPASTVGNIKMATYRVTCPDGSYDEADVYGSVLGSLPECEEPGGFLAPVISAPPSPYTADIEWVTPAVDPAGGYEWELYNMQSPGIPVQTGTSADKTVTVNGQTGLLPATDYGFYVRSVCPGGVYSPYSELLFTTPGSGIESCGTFILECNDGTLGATLYTYSFMDCNGNITSGGIINLTTKTECMLMDQFNVPIYFESNPPVTYLYDSPC